MIERLVIWYFLAALAYLVVSLLGGLLMALQLVNHNPLRGIELFSPGRWRMVHTNAIAYGFLANAFLGVAALGGAAADAAAGAERGAVVVHLRAPGRSWCSRTAGRHPAGPGAGRRMGRDAGLDRSAGAGRPAAGRASTSWRRSCKPRGRCTSRCGTSWRRSSGRAHLRHGQLPAASTSSPAPAAAPSAGLFIHDLVGLFVTPLGWGMMYYFVPIMLKKPIWSHGLSLVGFWGLAFFYPLTGIHHFLYTPIPMFLQYGAVISTIAVEFVVTTVIINFFGTIWGQAARSLRNLPLRWFYTGMIFYFITCFQCALQTTLTFQALIHFTDWVVGHAHLVMFGVFSFWLFGIMTYLFPRLLRPEWYSRRLCEWHYWLSAIGLFVMVVDLSWPACSRARLGVAEAWEDSIAVSHAVLVVAAVRRPGDHRRAGVFRRQPVQDFPAGGQEGK